MGRRRNSWKVLIWWAWGRVGEGRTYISVVDEDEGVVRVGGGDESYAHGDKLVGGLLYGEYRESLGDSFRVSYTLKLDQVGCEGDSIR